MPTLAKNIYYLLKPLIPRTVQIKFRRKIISMQRGKYKDIWPIDERAANPPKGWQGWPDRKRFALVLTHDVDTQRGHDRCYDLMNLESKLDFKSSFNFVPKRYNVSSKLRNYINTDGFEVGVHGLYHDGKYYKSKKIFQERAIQINHYLNEWKSVGFRSPSMLHNLEWIHALNIEYDASTFDTDPFEPQSDGVGTIFPFFVNGQINQRGYVELPYTLPQDFTLFVLMKERSIDIWKQKIDWIAENGGMVLLNTHPDYMNFNEDRAGIEDYPAEYYRELLEHIKVKYEKKYWHVLPKEIARFWTVNYAGSN